MLFRFISTVSLLIFLLLSISGTAIELAVFRSLVVFTMLFVVSYIAYFTFSVIQKKTEHTQPETAGVTSESNSPQSE